MKNRLLGIFLGLCVAALLLILLDSRRSAARWDLMPEFGGPMRAVALQYTAETAPATEPAYGAFLRAIDPTTRVIAICPDVAACARFRAFAVSCGRNTDAASLQTLAVGAPITTWCKDRFLVASGSPASIVTPVPEGAGPPGRANDALVAAVLARGSGGRYRAAQSPLGFESGDLMPTPTRLIFSDVLWDKNNRDPQFGSKLTRLFGRKLVWLHDVPVHHIGMFAAPLDDRTVAVGDPEAGRALWGPNEERLLGRADFSSATTAPFARAAQQLRSAGFRTIPLPTAVIAPKVYISYTNGVFETRNGRRIVYMPWYDAPRLDVAARAAYERAGWEVRPIPVRTLYRYRGTIGCLINVLEHD